MQPSPLIIITGPSGAGKGTLLRALEDRGYFSVENLPVGLLTKFVELLHKSDGEAQRGAIVIDVRGGKSVDEFLRVYGQLKEDPVLATSLCFLEASDDILIRRFSETRRPHPLDASRPVREAVNLERERLSPIRSVADHLIDTSYYSVHELRRHTEELFIEKGAASLLLSVVSFGYKYGIPVDTDMVLDVRFLPNPHFVAELKPLTGSDAAVVDYMRSHEATHGFLDLVRSMLDFLLPQFRKEGKSYLTIAIGCTGGRHRSVMIVDSIASMLSDDQHVKVIHRDIDK